MKLFRVLFVCTLFLLAVSPTFAAPQCQDCVNGECADTSSEHRPCRYTGTGCENYNGFCIGFSAADAGVKTVLSEWKVASIEITNELTQVVVTPSAIAQADTPAPTLQN
ncbi:MAG TPA: hypothetical protein VGQ76_11560 [Thermoanaerobaculia bacterium]|nr:hypothetical protein [Thermoanaerobaculia bacterium]